jgi:hypothetical protein
MIRLDHKQQPASAHPHDDTSHEPRSSPLSMSLLPWSVVRCVNESIIHSKYRYNPLNHYLIKIFMTTVSQSPFNRSILLEIIVFNLSRSLLLGHALAAFFFIYSRRLWPTASPPSCASPPLLSPRCLLHVVHPLPSSPLHCFARQPRGLLHVIASHPDPSLNLPPSLPPMPCPIRVRVLQAVRPLPASTRGGGEGVASAWCFSDPEMTRRQWVASYKAYSVEGKIDSSLSRGFRWIKAMCSELIHCWHESFFWELFSQYFVCICAAVCKVPHFYILFLFYVPIVFCNHRDNNISNYSVSCF